MSIITLILKNLKKCRKIFILFTITYILSCIILPIESYIYSRLIGCFEITNKSLAIQHCIIILQILIVYYITRSLINGFYSNYFKETFSHVFISHTITDIFTTIHTHPIRYFDEEMSGRISNSINNFSKQLLNIFTESCFLLIRPIISLITSFTIIATFSPKLSLSLFTLNIPYFWAIYKVNHHFFYLSNKYDKSQNKATGILVDSIANANLVKYSGSFFHEQIYFYKHLKQTLHIRGEQGRYQTFSRFLFHFIDTIFLTIGLLLILYFSKQDTIALDDLFYVYSTLGTMVIAIMMTENFFQRIFEIIGSLKANFDIINIPNELTEKENAQNIQPSTASISFNNIDFAYTKDNFIFQNLTLNIPSGQKIGIVGHSGSGKSTLINLLLRSYDVNKGSITINHTDIRDLTFRSLHKNIAVIPQETSLFNRSIIENLRISNPQATKKQIQYASKLANIHDRIMQLPNGYNSIVGERGIKLSGGERQRLTIARAILQNAPILILDEATSALDTESEILIEKAITQLTKNKTVIAIAHRLSTLRHMDRIIVINNGQIVEDGTFSSLSNKKDGIFHNLYKLQNNGYIVYGEKK